MTALFFQSMYRLRETVKLSEDQRLSLTSSAATGYVTQEATILQDGVPLDVFDSQAYNQGLGQSRAFASQFLNSFGGEIAGVLAELAKVIGPSTAAGNGPGVPPTDPTQILPLLYLYMASQGTAAFESVAVVNSRNLTRGSPSYGSGNVGNGTLYRLNTDAYGYPMEGGFAETLNAICTKDAQSGTLVGQEQFAVNGQPFRDALTWFATGYGSGITSQLVGVTADTTQSLIQNSSFSQSTGTGGASSFALTGWTQTSGLAASMSLDTTNYYRAAAIEGTTPASLKATASVAITQKISTNGASLALTAYLWRLAVNFSQFSGTGSVAVQVGSRSATVNSGVAGWNLLVPTLDQNLWFQNFNTAQLAVTITITVSGGTAILVDDFCWSPMTDIGGSLYWLIGGSTNWLVNDSITVVDSEPNPPSKVQNWIRLMFPGFYLPAKVLTAAPASAPTLAVSGSAATVTAGPHVGYFSFYNGSTGIESPLSPASNIVVMDGTKSIDWSGVIAGPAGTTARRLYRTKAGGVIGRDTPYFVAEIADNVTTTYADTTADGSLTLQPGPVGDPS